MKYTLLLAFSLVFSSQTRGAACCGTSAQIPSLISGDDRFQIATTVSMGQVVAEVSPTGIRTSRPDNDSEFSQNLKLDAAFLLSDRFQMGGSLPLMRRTRSREDESLQSAGLGDIQIDLAYEALPEWNYSALPKGFVFLNLTLPTGTSLYDSNELYRIDVRGQGFAQIGLGAHLVKTIRDFDFSLTIEGHRSLARAVSQTSGQSVFTPGFGGSAALSVGYSPGGRAFRLGLSQGAIYEESIVLTGAWPRILPAKSLWSPSLTASYLIDSSLSVSLTYSDPTLLPLSSNTSLQRSVAFLVQKRWER